MELVRMEMLIQEKVIFILFETWSCVTLRISWVDVQSIILMTSQFLMTVTIIYFFTRMVTLKISTASRGSNVNMICCVMLPMPFSNPTHLTKESFCFPPAQDVSCNEITALPQHIGRLKALRELNVRRNLLFVLPEGEFGQRNNLLSQFTGQAQN